MSFDEILNKTYRETFPLKTKIISEKTLRNPWLSKSIKNSIKKRSWYFKLYSAGLISLETRNRYRNTLNRVILAAKQNYFKEKFSQNRCDSGKSWKIINHALNRNITFSKISEIRINNSLISNESEISNEFNNFFFYNR